VANGQVAILHIEFQGRNSHKPMPLRQLEYLVRLTNEYRKFAVHSVVIYVGEGAGKDDMGSHAFYRLDGKAVISWYYDVIRLWEMTTEELLALNKPALLGFLGQTKTKNPTVELPLVVARLGQIEDAEKRGRITAALLDLIPDKELLAMIEKLLVEDELFTDTPYMQLLRERYEEKRRIGHKEGLQEGLKNLQESIEMSRKEAALTIRQKDILQILRARFAPPAAVSVQLEAILAKLTDEEALQALLITASLTESLAAFQTALAQQTAQAQN
jgi:predicted transposase YdaD